MPSLSRMVHVVLLTLDNVFDEHECEKVRNAYGEKCTGQFLHVLNVSLNAFKHTIPIDIVWWANLDILKVVSFRLTMYTNVPTSFMTPYYCTD
jgi:hypothetical protein